MDRDTKIGIFLYILTAVVVFIFIVLMIVESAAYTTCVRGQNINCLQFACKTSGPKCGNYAIRTDSDGNSYCSNAPETPLSS